ncbi:MAG: hypothetical protein KC776_41365, partial [Myxococcales bacterium]|nr:hypothetical protein [Myxococcales bacterium]
STNPAEALPEPEPELQLTSGKQKRNAERRRDAWAMRFMRRQSTAVERSCAKTSDPGLQTALH